MGGSRYYFGFPVGPGRGPSAGSRGCGANRAASPRAAGPGRTGGARARPPLPAPLPPRAHRRAEPERPGGGSVAPRGLHNRNGRAVGRSRGRRQVAAAGRRGGASGSRGGRRPRRHRPAPGPRRPPNPRDSTLPQSPGLSSPPPPRGRAGRRALPGPAHTHTPPPNHHLPPPSPRAGR